MIKNTCDTSSTLVHKVVELALRRHSDHRELLNSPTLLLSCATLEELERRNRIISAYLASQDPLKTKLIQLHFFQGKLSPEAIAQALSMNRFAFFMMKKEILTGLTAELGWDI